MKATQGTGRKRPRTATAARERSSQKATKAGRGKDTNAETQKTPYRAKSEMQTQPTRARTDGKNRIPYGHGRTQKTYKGTGRRKKAQVIYFGK